MSRTACSTSASKVEMAMPAAFRSLVFSCQSCSKRTKRKALNFDSETTESSNYDYIS